MPKLELDKFKSFGNASLRSSTHLNDEDAAKIKVSLSPKRETPADEVNQASMLKDESIKVPTLFAPAKLKKKIAPKKGVPIGTIGEKSTRRRGISPMRGASPVPPPSGAARRGRSDASPVPGAAARRGRSTDYDALDKPRKRDKSVDAAEAESLFQDVRSLLNPVRRASAMPSRRASLPPTLRKKQPSFRVALKKPRRPSIPTKLPSQVDKNLFHIPYAKKASNNFLGPGKGGPGYGPIKKRAPRLNGGGLSPKRQTTREAGFRLPCLRHVAKQSPLPKGELGASVTLKRVPRSSNPEPKEGEQLVLLKSVLKKWLPPDQDEKETFILKPLPRYSPVPPGEEGELAILKIRPKGYEAPEEEEGEVVHLKPIPRKYQPGDKEVEMVSLKPIPRKSKATTLDSGSLSSKGGDSSGFRLPCLRRVATYPPPKGESVGASITLKRVPRNTRPKEGEGELVVLKPVSKKLLPPNQNEKETVILKSVPRNAPPPQEGELAILKVSPKRYGAPEKEEGEVIHLKPIARKYQPKEEEEEMVTLKPIPRKSVPIREEGERVLLKPIPRKSPLPSEKEGEVVLLKPIRKKLIRPNGAEEAVVLKPVHRDSPPKDDEEGELVLLKPIARKSLPPKEEEGEKVVLLKPIPKKDLPPDEQEGEVVTLKTIPQKELEEEMEESNPQPVSPTEEPALAPEEPASAPARSASCPPEEENPAVPPEPAVNPAPVEPSLSPSPKQEKPAAAPKPAGTPTPSAAPNGQSAAAAPHAAPADNKDDGRIVKDDGTIIIRTADVYMAFNIPDCSMEPSDKDYVKLTKSTQKFFEAHIKKKFPTCQKLSLAKHKSYFGKNIPSADYNVYVEWDIQAEFHGTSPDQPELCQSLVRKTNLGKYMSKHLSNLFKSPWKQADAVFIEQVSETIMLQK